MNQLELSITLVGRTLTGARQIFYIHQGILHDDGGPLELRFADGTVVLFDAGGDGETLEIRLEPWVDNFSEPLSDGNREFVHKSGKWTAFDISASDTLRPAIGKAVTKVEVQEYRGKTVGARILVGPLIICPVVDSDELTVRITS